MLTLSQLLETIEEGQIAKADFADSYWYVIMLSECLWYWYPEDNSEGSTILKGEIVGDRVTLTYSNKKALYTIQGGQFTI